MTSVPTKVTVQGISFSAGTNVVRAGGENRSLDVVRIAQKRVIRATSWLVMGWRLRSATAATISTSNQCALGT